MSAYTERRGLRLKQSASMFFSLRSNHRCTLITGMPSSSSSCWKNGSADHALGRKRLNTSTGIADTYSSASTTSPPRSTRWLTEASAFGTISSRAAPRRTAPPRCSMCCTIGAQRRSGWFPSKKAVWLPSLSLMKRFIAVSTTVIESLSGSMKSRAFAIATKISCEMRSGMPYFLMNWLTDSSSCASMKLCPSKSIGRRGGPVCSFSRGLSIFWFSRIAAAMFRGAGRPGNSKVVNSPGSSCIAKVIWCLFHCNLSSIPSSAKRFIMFGYAPKKMCKPVSTQSPSSSCHADTFPPSTSRASSTTGWWPASARYLAQASPDSPPPMTATRFLGDPASCSARNLAERALASA
mmetsp:Transcript_24989/g.65917  ORF Transcript_24989/g.65917 Transcript_24989/m.65917 type:complete len:350 (-) Transcript_24989:121-1170(-)